jgi:hypothetical protein
MCSAFDQNELCVSIKGENFTSGFFIASMVLSLILLLVSGTDVEE